MLSEETIGSIDYKIYKYDICFPLYFHTSSINKKAPILTYYYITYHDTKRGKVVILTKTKNPLKI